MRIFITGGTGFIGSHLVPLLQERGHQLALFNRKDADRLELILSDFKPEVALHLAWEGLPDYSWPLCTKNLQWGLGLYAALLRNGCKKVITTGTCWEYGDVNAFVAAKTSLRLMGEAYARDKKSEFVWTRLFFVYGPGQRKTSLIPSLVQKIKSKQKPELKNPDARHDFIYVKDVAQALVLLTENQSAAKIIDIGSGCLYSVADVAETVLQIMSHENPPRREVPEGDKGKLGEADTFCANTSDLEKMGWKPKYDLTTGIWETLQ